MLQLLLVIEQPVVQEAEEKIEHIAKHDSHQIQRQALTNRPVALREQRASCT